MRNQPLFRYIAALLFAVALFCLMFVPGVRAADVPVLMIRASTEIAGYRGMGEAFRAESDADTVRFCFASGGKRPAAFDVSLRELQEYTSKNTILSDLSDFTLPLATLSAAFTVTDWENNAAPKFNKSPLALEPNEISRSLVIAPNSTAFLLGTDSYLRCYNRSGKALWKTPAPKSAWGVNISGDGEVALGAFGDGTIRWFRMTDGKELLAFLPHPDGKRWVVWTPSGYYDCSPGGESLIGWQIKRGVGVADFYPASAFRAVFYRPDVVSLVLRARSEADGIGLANDLKELNKLPVAKIEELLPPVLTIVAPASGAGVSTGTIRVRYTVRSPANAPVQAVRALIDGRPAENNRAWVPAKAASTAKEASGEISVNVPERDCEVSLVATNKNAASAPVTLRVRWAGAVPANNTGEKQEVFVIKPKLYVLAVGVSKYAAPGHDLEYAAKDARDFCAAMQKQSGGLYREVVVKTLTDSGAKQADVLDGLEWVQRETTAKDIAMVFFSGHGENDPDGDYHFLTHDFDDVHWKRTAVSFAQIQATLKNIKGKTLFFVDSCHSGNVLGTARARGSAPDIVRVVNELASAENGVVVFAASTGKQFALEDKEWNNGAFTKALLEAVGGGADYGKTGRITINMIDLYISERVKELTKGKQTPTTTKPATVADYPVAVRQ